MRRMCDGHRGIIELDKTDIVQRSGFDPGVESVAALGPRVVIDDRPARNLMPIVEPVARMNGFRRKQRFRVLAPSMSCKPSNSAVRADSGGRVRNYNRWFRLRLTGVKGPEFEQALLFPCRR